MPGLKGLHPAQLPALMRRGVERRHNRWLVALTLGSAVATQPALADPIGPDADKFHDERLEPGIYPAAPAEPAHSPFDLDWSVGLKGTYTSSSRDGGQFLTTLNPQFTAVHDGVRTDLTIDGSAELARTWDADDTIELPALRLGLSASTSLDRNTRLTGEAALTVNRQLASAPGLDPVMLDPPRVIEGSLGAGIERSFGRFNVSLDGDLSRTVHGDTLRADTGVTDNSHRNLWEADTSLRVGYQVTPIFEVFGVAGLGRDMFDDVTPGLGVAPDATSRTLRGGIAADWNGIVSATASVGVGEHDFDAAGYADVTTRLYDASVSYSPDPTVNVTGRLATEIAPAGADSSGTAQIEHVATASASYVVNSWLRLRASADWSRTLTEGTGETEVRSGAGAGADYVFNSRTALSADYGYSHVANSISGDYDVHRVSLGLTLKR